MVSTLRPITLRLAAATLLTASIVGAAGAQSFTAPALSSAERAKIAARPFAPGELLTYNVHFGSLKVGTGTMEVRGIESVRGRAAYHTIFRAQGGIPLFRVDDRFESWFSTDDLSSLRFYKDHDEGFKEREAR